MVNILENILQERYNECNSQGHLKSNTETNYCNYCYRHIKEENLEDYERGLKKLAEEIAIKLQIIG